MRPIKFRAWDHVNGKMLADEIESIAFAKNGLPANASVSGFSMPLLLNGNEPQLSLMQYTGLKDKNGKEIYEGDIVSGHNGDGSPNVWPVEYACENSEWTGFNVGADDERDCEVIGNIYENPELLK
jgi:uncharacterized phage protein (TIGR01671 family)